MKYYLLLTASAMSALSCLAQPCTPFDPSFGTGGKVFSIYAPTISGTRNLIVQADGKIVQLGTVKFGNVNQLALVRYTVNGSIDSTFGTNGVSTAAVGTLYTEAGYMVQQPDGKFVVAGTFANTNYISETTVVRFLPNGQPDNTFGVNGIVRVNINPANEYINSLALQSDGKIIVSGSSQDSAGISQFSIARLKATGVLDSSFGQNGIISKHFGHFIGYVDQQYVGTYSYEEIRTMVIQPDDKIVVAGYSYGDSCMPDGCGGFYCDPAMVLARYKTNGTLDSSFGSNGKVMDTTSLTGPAAMLLQSDGKIVITGYGLQNGFITRRYQPNGAPDMSFGTGGKSLTQFPPAYYSTFSNAIVQMTDGRFVLLGNSYTNNYIPDCAVARLKVNGTPDSTFNGTGKATFHVSPLALNEFATGLGLQGNKIIAGGSSQTGSSGGDVFAVVRLPEPMHTIDAFISYSGNPNFCFGDSIRLSAGSITGSYQWYRDGTAISAATDSVFMAKLTGTYNVTVTTPNGCGTSGPVGVYVRPIPPIPVIQQNSIQLYTASGYQRYDWYLNNALFASLGPSGYILNTTPSGTYQVKVTNSSYCSSMSAPFVFQVVGLPTVNGNTQSFIYPNPATGTLYLDIPDGTANKSKAALYDIDGRLIRSKELTPGKNKWDVEGLASGVYQLEVTTGKKKSITRVVLINQ